MKIYFAGSISGGRNFENNLLMISKMLEKMGHTVMTKDNVVKTNDLKRNNSSSLSFRKYIVKRDLKWIETCDLFIAEVSTYSHGVGYEHRCAEEFKKPILLLRNNSLSKDRYTAFFDGSEYDKLTFSFYDSGNIEKILERFIKKYER